MNILFPVVLGTYLGVELLGHINSGFSFLRDFQPVFHSSCPILHSHQQFSPYLPVLVIDLSLSSDDKLIEGELTKFSNIFQDRMPFNFLKK